MPYSSPEGKLWILTRVRLYLPASVLDIGPGAGVYAGMLREHWSAGPFTCIEIYEPYVDRFGLQDLYDTVIVGDARGMELPEHDVVILGDVLEHMELVEATALWEAAASAARKAVFLSIPIVVSIQDDFEGNPYERHVTQWTHEQVLAEFLGITEFATYSQIGVYERRTT